MSSICAAGCLDAQAPVRVSFVNLDKWRYADAEFLRNLCMNQKRETGPPSFNSEICLYRMILASRQRYLRSYTFSMTVPDKTKRWLREKQKAVKAESKHRSSSASRSFLEAVFKFLFSCVAEVDVHDLSTKIERK
ncbi:hypothetical protein CJ030_MR5G002852 [Morella rubra]|uniref:Uncharacterized protein n=1 Tax=Morella rubra TaxID=262757 RepID=A0A6A1VP11_9ROSI|nr:hypothetical protein CJ030_MR8G019486 [Morella rubra]KAB1214621.1 hypothetical protein CJ030_MR5G002852 [Morella rubra]